MEGHEHHKMEHQHHDMGHEHSMPTVSAGKMWGAFILSLLGLAIGIAIAVIGWIFI